MKADKESLYKVVIWSDDLNTATNDYKRYITQTPHPYRDALETARKASELVRAGERIYLEKMYDIE